MIVERGDFISGNPVVSITDRNFCLTLCKNEATFSDGIGDIIIECLTSYDVDTITDAEAKQHFIHALEYFQNLEAVMKNIDNV
jgi:hypothetical protein